MRFLLALFALCLAVPASAATYRFEASWLHGDPFFTEYVGLPGLYETPRPFIVRIDEPENPFARFQCGDLACQYPGNLSLGEDRIVGTVGASGGQMAVFNVTGGTGTFSYICDCGWWDPASRRFFTSQSYTLALTAVPALVPLPASLPLMLAALAGLGLWHRRQRASA